MEHFLTNNPNGVATKTSYHSPVKFFLQVTINPLSFSSWSWKKTKIWDFERAPGVVGRSGKRRRKGLWDDLINFDHPISRIQSLNLPFWRRPAFSTCPTRTWQTSRFGVTKNGCLKTTIWTREVKCPTRGRLIYFYTNNCKKLQVVSNVKYHIYMCI